MCYLSSPLDGLSLKVAYVDVSADEGKTVDDFSEFNFDGQYTSMIGQQSGFDTLSKIKQIPLQEKIEMI